MKTIKAAYTWKVYRKRHDTQFKWSSQIPGLVLTRNVIKVCLQLKFCFLTWIWNFFQESQIMQSTPIPKSTRFLTTLCTSLKISNQLFFSTFFYVDNNNILNTQNRICMNRIKKIPFVMERIKEIESRHYLLPVMILWVRLPSPLFWYLFKNSR